MDNGTEVFAKLPNPNAGPSRYMTASEVATHELLRNVFQIPVPRILALSFDATDNPVGTEYIIAENASGVRLGSIWGQWSREAKLRLITQIVDMENTLTTISFPKHGSIYFKDNLRLLTGKSEEINVELATTKSLNRFSIGFITSPELWDDNRREMELDRGPWLDSQEYTQALGRNEIAWIKSYARPRMNYHKSTKDLEVPDEGHALLAPYMKLAPHLVPKTTDEAANSNVLWHPDLHLDNVFVNPDTHKITSILDWQSACVAPLFYQSGIPKMFRHPRLVREGWVVPERPENFDTLEENEQKRIDDVWRVKLYISTMKLKFINDLHATGLFSVKQQSQLSGSLSGCQLPCPIEFTTKDLELHAKEEENMDGIGHMVALFRDQGVLPVEGMVDPKDFEVARENSRKFKEVFVSLAENKAERELYENIWPYQEPTVNTEEM
ncbi:Phosphotransferase enzyme family [Aspergillus sclerotialis]|uniref:Altered inheritance of mitochondria protein 9, mitochondrial n=1 Tax=Aspergillus sclerotialis TaxID=2070753 RepID=A0A3A3A3V5_9EURO|nr:Phosphotransferase enzyme family [Aspergillus sclerotialis]